MGWLGRGGGLLGVFFKKNFLLVMFVGLVLVFGYVVGLVLCYFVKGDYYGVLVVVLV